MLMITADLWSSVLVNVHLTTDILEKYQLNICRTILGELFRFFLYLI